MLLNCHPDDENTLPLSLNNLHASVPYKCPDKNPDEGSCHQSNFMSD